MIPKVYLNPKLSLYERRRQLIAVLYERQSDTVGNLAFEFNVSFHTIRNDIRILELEYPIYTRMGAGGGVFIFDSSRLQQRWLTVRQRELLLDVCGALDDEQALLMRSIIGGLSPLFVNVPTAQSMAQRMRMGYGTNCERNRI